MSVPGLRPVHQETKNGLCRTNDFDVAGAVGVFGERFVDELGNRSALGSASLRIALSRPPKLSIPGTVVSTPRAGVNHWPPN